MDKVKRRGRCADINNRKAQMIGRAVPAMTYDYIGTDCCPDNPDIQKAISDMKQDQVLQSYQYFVGNQEC